MSDLERTTSLNGFEIIEEAEAIEKAKKEAEGSAEPEGDADRDDKNDDGPVKEEAAAPERRIRTPEEKRLERQKRRKQSRLAAFIFAFIILAVLCAGGVIGFRALKANDQSPEIEPIEAEEVVDIEEKQPVIDMTPIITEEPEPEEEVEQEPEPEQTREELLEEMVTNMIADMTLEDKVAGLFIVTPESLTGQSTVTKAGDGTKEALEKYPVGGIVYFKQNITSSDQVKEMIDNTVSFCRYPLFIAVDEEGGDVARVQQGLKLDKTPTAKELGEENNTTTTFDNYSTIGQYLAEYGFNLDFAPVGDVLTNPDNKAIGDRAFGTDADTVSNMVVSAIGGLKEQNIVTCIKHFPGQGDADGDTHQTLASTSRTRAEMEECEFKPFKAAIENGVDMIMVGHLSADALMEEKLPCSLSKEVMTELLRGELGYDGVIITDSMSMAAVSDYYGADEAAIKALKAGADMILMPEDFQLAYDGVIAAVNDGTIDVHRIDDSLARVYKVKYRDKLQEEE